MQQKGLIILGSSNSQGDTFAIVKYLQEIISFDIIDLNDYDIGPFDYEFKNKGDDFIPLIKKIVAEYDTIVFATPVYWYSMSATMKIFFDRISDCLKIEKPTGRQLRGKNMAALCCSSGPEEYEEFFMPFKRSAEYLGMNYLGDLHTWTATEGLPQIVQQKIIDFARIL